MRFRKWLLISVLLISIITIIALTVPFFTLHGRGNLISPDESTAYNLKNAISAYFTEYREYPLRSPDIDITVDTRSRLIAILLGSDAERSEDGRNHRGIAFYTDKAAKTTKKGRFYKGISLDENGRGFLWDTWGNPYRVCVDSNFDNKVDDPESPGSTIPESVAVWSAGKDGNFETWDDNVKTW
jgi:type II secretory pathway pseudopilin PulG